MYGSQRPPSRSLLGDMFGFDPLAMLRAPEAMGFEVERTENGYRIEIPVAGFRPDEITVTIEDRQLRVEGRGERRRFTRAVTLPDEIDTERVQATVEHGLLTLMLPLNPKLQPRTIEVRVGEGALRGAGTVPSVSGDTGPPTSGATQHEEPAQPLGGG